MNAPFPAGHMAQAELEYLPVGSIRPSGTPIQALRRARFNSERLFELAASIKEAGVIEPIIVRPITPDGHVKYELVAGERRWIASDRAGLAHVPAIVRNLTAAQVLTTQLIENKQRDDYTPLEEGQGYKDLMDLDHLDAEQVGTMIGKSRAYVYARRKLLDLCPQARNALQGGLIDASKGLLIARLGAEKLQVKALELMSETNWRGEPISYKAAFAAVRDKCMKPLGNAPFTLDDATLYRPMTKADPGYLVHDWHKVKLVSNRDGSDDYACERCPAKFKRRRLGEELPLGPCKAKNGTVALPPCLTCPHYSGQDAELRADLADADVCTNVDCFEAKVLCVGLKRKAQAEEAGTPVLSGEEAKKIAPRKDKLVGYVDLDEPCDWDHFAEPEPEPKADDPDGESADFKTLYAAWERRSEAHQHRTYRQLLGDAKVDVKLLEDPKTKKVRELIPVKQARQLLAKQHEIKLPGHVAAPAPKSATYDRAAEHAKYEAEQKARQEREARELLYRQRILQAIAAKCAGPVKRDELVDISDQLLEDHATREGLKFVYEKLPEPGQLKEADLGKLIRLAGVADSCCWAGRNPGPLLALAKRFKVDVSKVKAAIAAEEKAKTKAEKDAEKKGAKK